MMNVKRDSRPIPLTLRVLLFVMLAIGLCLLLSRILILSFIQHHFAEQDADELRVINASIHTVLKKADQQRTISEALLHAVSGHHGVFFKVEDAQGNTIYKTAGANFAPERQTTEATRKSTSNTTQNSPLVTTWRTDGKTYRGTINNIQTELANYKVTVALDMSFHLHFLESFRRSLWLIMFVTGAFTLFAAWLGIRQGHQPLRALTHSIRQIQTSKLDMRLAPNCVPVELQELVLSFNHMIERLEDGFTRLSHFSSDIAHELRTPLTNLITQTQVALSKPRGIDEYRELLYSSLEEEERLTKMVNDMLWLAKSDNNLITLELEELDLHHEITELFDFFDALAAEKNVKLELIGQPLFLKADRALLRRAFSNLISNAIRYTPKDNAIKIHLTDQKNLIVVAITNPGDTIPPNHLTKLFDRFYRIDPSRHHNTDGAGLGLAIVKSIIKAHAGTITAESTNGLTQFKITLHR